MSSKTLCNLIRAAVIAVAACGLAGCGYILPTIGADLILSYPEFAHCYTPWVIFLWVSAAPCFALLALVWQVSSAIRSEQVFTHKGARIVKNGALLLFCAVGIFFLGNAVFLALNMSHPAIFLVSLFVDVLGLALATAAAAVSRYLTKATALQEEADSTI